MNTCFCSRTLAPLVRIMMTMVLIRLTAGLAFTTLGIVGLVLPILPGWIFFPVAAALFFPRSRFTHRVLAFAHEKTPPLARMLRRLGVG